MTTAAGGLALGLFPWTVLLPGSFVLLVHRRPLPVLAVVSLAWLVVVLVVFLVAISPRAVYFLPACPALALIAAWGWQTACGKLRGWMAWPLVLAVAAVVATGIVIGVRPTRVSSHGDSLVLPPVVGLASAGFLLVVAVLALRSERRGRSLTAVALLATGVVVTLLAFDAAVRTPFYNRLYPIRASARHLETRIGPGAEVGYTEDHRGTALAVYLSRPLRQLPHPEVDQPPTPAPPYVLLWEADFLKVRETWSLRQVDEVYFRRVRYILAATSR